MPRILKISCWYAVEAVVAGAAVAVVAGVVVAAVEAVVAAGVLAVRAVFAAPVVSGAPVVFAVPAALAVTLDRANGAGSRQKFTCIRPCTIPRTGFFLRTAITPSSYDTDKISSLEHKQAGHGCRSGGEKCLKCCLPCAQK